MKLYLIIGFLFFASSCCFAQQNPAWTKCSWLIGEWKGEGKGIPGQGGGIFTFKMDLNNNILVRKAHSEYPAEENKPSVIHDDLLIVYLDYNSTPSKAIYFDNEGHTINYTVSCQDQTIVFLSNKIPNAPFFRLTYTLLNSKEINTKFEMSKDGKEFTTYIEGNSVKIR